MFTIETSETLDAVIPVYRGSAKQTISGYDPNWAADEPVKLPERLQESYYKVKGTHTSKFDEESLEFIEDLLITHGALTWEMLKKLTRFSDDRLSDSIAQSFRIYRKGLIYHIA